MVAPLLLHFKRDLVVVLQMSGFDGGVIGERQRLDEMLAAAHEEGLNFIKLLL